MMGSIHYLAGAIKKDLLTALPYQRKTQRDKLALLVATMLHAKTANTMELAAQLPIATERLDMRYQWVSRFLSNPFVDVKEVIKPLGLFVLEKLIEKRHTLVLVMDQTYISKNLSLLMLSVRWGARAVPLLWCVRKTSANIGFEEQKTILDEVAVWIPEQAQVILMADRFYGTADLITYCRNKKWDYRLRLKDNIVVHQGVKEYRTGELEKLGMHFLENVSLTNQYVKTNIGVIHESGHKESWIIAMSQKPNFYRGLDYGMRWCIEPMFSDFKSKGFGLEDTHLRYCDRVERLILIMAIGMIWSALIGMWEACHHPLPYERKSHSKKA